MSEQVDELRAEVDRLRVQLAGCGVAALGGGPLAKQGDYGWSASYQDVVDLRCKYEAAVAIAVNVAGEQ